MWAGWVFGDTGGGGRRGDGALDDGLVQVVAAALACDLVDVLPGGGEDPLPSPFTRGGGILGPQGVRQLDEAGAGAKVGRVLVADSLNVHVQVALDGSGKLLPGEVDVLDAKLQRLEQA